MSHGEELLHGASLAVCLDDNHHHFGYTDGKVPHF